MHLFQDEKFLEEYERMERRKQRLETSWDKTPQKILDEMLSGERDINTQDCNGITFLVYVMKMRIMPIKNILQFLSDKQANVKAIDEEGNTLAHLLYRNFYTYELLYNTS